MNNIFFINKTFLWLSKNVKSLNKSWRSLRELTKPKSSKELAEYKKRRKTHINKIILSSLMIITVIFIALSIIFITAVLISRLIGWFLYLWRTSLVVKAFITITLVITILGFFVLIFNKASGFKPKVVLNESEKAECYQFILNIVFEILNKTADALNLVPPAHPNELIPYGKNYYTQNSTVLYVFTCLKNGEVNIEKINNVFEMELLNNQTSGRMGTLGEFNWQGKLFGGLILIDIKESSDYARFEIAFTDNDSFAIYRKRSEQKRIKKINERDKNDEDF